MSMVFSVLAIVIIILIGASLLTLLGIVLSLGHYDKKEVIAKFESEPDDPSRWSHWPECS